MAKPRKTSPAVGLYQGGIISLIESAVREDGAVFTRHQDKTLYGYRWGPWRFSGQRVDPKALPGVLEAGFSTLYPHHYKTGSTLRLPLALEEAMVDDAIKRRGS